jgi:hypothetical protein
VSAWQHPFERCSDCGQDILLWPEVTPDSHLVYVRACPRCDAGEPIAMPRERSPWADEPLDREASWRVTERPTEPVEAEGASPRPIGSVPQMAERVAAPASGAIDLWWDGWEDGRHRAAGTIDDRWARFAAGDDEDDLPLAAEGTFVFGSEDVPRRRRSMFRLRQSA